LGVRLAVLTEPPPPEGAPLSDAPHFARPAPPKGDDLYNKAGYKELRDAWNPQWKEADRLASLDDPKLLEQWLYRHAAHVGANGVTHGEQALMATITPEVQSQLHATPSFVAELEGQPRVFVSDTARTPLTALGQHQEPEWLWGVVEEDTFSRASPVLPAVLVGIG
jgi:hypothetical protein